MTPETRKEKYLAKASGDYSGELPEPVTREEKYLFKIAESGGGGGDSSEYAHSLELSINSQTYVLTATLKNTSGETLGTPQTIDLPLETMVVGGSYDDTTKKVILTLKNGNTVDFSVADLIDGLQSEITSTNKLNSDLVDDTNQNNKFVTSAEKTKIANALTEEVYNAGKTVPEGTTYTVRGMPYIAGSNAEIFGDYTNNKAIGNYSHSEGTSTSTIGNYSHAEGNWSSAKSSCAHAEGNNTTAGGANSHAEGNNTTAGGANSHAEGNSTIASSDSQHAQGKFNIEDSGNKYAFIIGNGTYLQRSNAFAVDWDGLIYVNNASTGVNVSQLLTEEVYNAGKTVPYGTQYVIAGETYTVGNHAEIFNNYDINKAIGEYSHAEGNRTTATGYASHAEGGALLASGTSSHAEGGGTTASGNYSHAEGNNTKASGTIAHAEGEFTNANGRNAHTEGIYTIASSDNQHVQGKYNVEDSNSKYAFIIGNGTSTSARSNAFAVDWDGKIYVNNAETGVDVSEHNSKLIKHDSALAELIDSGQKNLASVNSGTFTAPTTPDGARYIAIPVTGVSGDVVLYTDSLESDDTTVTTCGLRLRFSDDTTQTIQINRGNNVVTNISLAKELTEIGIYPANGYTASAGKSLSFQNLMLCSKAAWDISQNYVPYRPSYDELVARITALENA